MKANLYWTIQHLKRGMHDIRFAAKCWWLSQQIEFLTWRIQVDLRFSVPAPAVLKHGDRSRRFNSR